GVCRARHRAWDVSPRRRGAGAGGPFPLMAGIGARTRRQLADFALQYLELAVASGLLIALGLSFFSGPLLTFLYGGHYDAARPTLLVLAWVAPATLVTNVFTPLILALERPRTLPLATPP